MAHPSGAGYKYDARWLDRACGGMAEGGSAEKKPTNWLERAGLDLDEQGIPHWKEEQSPPRDTSKDNDYP
jgi:hypothetical protein